MAHPIFVASDPNATRIDIVLASEFETYTKNLSASDITFLGAQGFKGDAGSLALLPDRDGGIGRAVFGLGKLDDPFIVAALPGKLQKGTYRLGFHPDSVPFELFAMAWLDGAYSFERYKSSKTEPKILSLADGASLDGFSALERATYLLRDLVNTPAADMGPTQIEATVTGLAEEFSAQLTVTRGADLLARNYPMVHAVGRAASDAPRFLELSWGDTANPTLAIVGKGVAFDTGGLNLKMGQFMRLMKKDMGGAAHAIALARLVMDLKLPVQLKLFIPAVENAIGAGAFRPGDILSSRKGLTVEIEDTDAEGRLILGDALTRACEMDPDLVIDFATLTGAARVALGPTLAPFYTDDDDVASAIESAAIEKSDPVWRMPMWNGYAGQLKSPIADLKNLGDSGMGGSILAALFLRNFVDRKSWVHFDVWAWREGRYGRPAGGAANGLRAVWSMLQKRYPR